MVSSTPLQLTKALRRSSLAFVSNGSCDDQPKTLASNHMRLAINRILQMCGIQHVHVLAMATDMHQDMEPYFRVRRLKLVNGSPTWVSADVP